MFRLRIVSNIINIRRYSTGQKRFELLTDEKAKISTLILQKPPVNSLNLPFLAEIGSVLDELENKKCKGLILTSCIPNIFISGVDLKELYDTDAKKLETFWLTFRGTWLKLFTAPFPTVALVNGYAIGGGCMLAMSCEYRIMLDSKHGTIGLNEARIGITFPQWFTDLMQSLIGYRKTEMAITTGHLFAAEEALQIGLADKIVQNESEAQNEINDFFKKANAVDATTRGLIKNDYRKHIVERFLNEKDKDVQAIISSILAPQTQQNLKVYIERLKKKN